jgi:molybdopterin molybdotransferase
MMRTLVDDCFRPDQPRLRHAEALQLLRQRISPLSRPVDITLTAAAGRILAASVISAEPIPAHTNSAVDGYAFAHAVYSTDVQGRRLEIVGRASAGHPLSTTLAPGQAARILTGAVMPEGADAVAMQEDCDRLGGSAQVLVPTGLKPGANVRKAGEDVQAGTLLYKAGHTLAPQDLAALAAAGCSQVSCYVPLRVAIVSTGDEILPAGSAALEPGQVYDANAPMLAALAARAGTEADILGIWPDRLDAVTDGLTAAAKRYDVILTSGGASLGEEDHMARALGQVGQRHLWQLAIKPGRPMMFGQIRNEQTGRDTIVVGLPGNPVAVFVCFLMYVYPLLRAAGGAHWPEPRRFLLPAAFDFKGRKTGRREFWRGRLGDDGGRMIVEKFPRDGSGLISGLRWAEGLIDIPEDHGDIAKGDPVAFIPFSEF